MKAALYGAVREQQKSAEEVKADLTSKTLVDMELLTDWLCAEKGDGGSGSATAAGAPAVVRSAPDEQQGARAAATAARPIALLLDCDERMAEAFKDMGYRVHLGKTGHADGVQRLPLNLYETDVVVYDLHRPARINIAAWRRAAELGRAEFAGPPAPHWRAFEVEAYQPPSTYPLSKSWLEENALLVETFDGSDEIPMRRLMDAWRSVQAGTVLICFLNRAMMPPGQAHSLIYWALWPYDTDVGFEPRADSPSRCVVESRSVWGDFFAQVRAPLVCAVPTWSVARMNATPILRNRVGEAHAAMFRKGASPFEPAKGALFLLPEFEDNAAAAKRLVTEIWPELKGPEDQRTTVGGETAARVLRDLGDPQTAADTGAPGALVPMSEELAKLEKQTPRFDAGSDDWVRNKVAAAIENLTTRTLATYRTEGKQTKDGRFGIDKQGRIWRRPGTPRSHPWYLRSTLKKKA